MTAVLTRPQPVPTAAPTAPAPTGRLPGLDGLRALAIIAVVVYHLDPAWLPGGFLGVDLFFVISGFLITKLLLDRARAHGSVGIGAFYARRARRILPATVLVIGVLVLAAMVGGGLARLGTGDVLAGLGFATNWWQIVEGWDYFHAWEAPSSLQHLWSLAIEEQFYLVWPALLALVLVLTRRRPRRTYALVGVLATLGALASTGWMWYLAVTTDVPYTTSASRVYYGTDTHISGILIGAATAACFAFATQPPAGRHHRPPVRPTRRGRALVDLLGFAAVGGLVASALWFHEHAPPIYRGGFLTVALLSAVAIACVTRRWSLLGRALDTQPLRWIGLISFELYLWHWPVGVAWTTIQPEPGVWGTVAQVAVMVALAGVTHHWVTVPIWHPRPGRAIWPGVAPLSAVAAAVVAVALAVPLLLHGPARPIVSSAAQPVVTLPELPDPEPTSRVLGAEALTWPISAFGDSVMMGAVPSMRSVMPKLEADAAGNRQFTRDMAPMIRGKLADGTLGPIVVIHAGQNGRLVEEDVSALLSDLSDRTLVVLVTVTLPRFPGQERDNNQVITTVAPRFPNVVVADWKAHGAEHPEWFSADGTHLSGAGRVAYAQFIAATIAQFEAPVV